jgi:hypothetical protein
LSQAKNFFVIQVKGKLVRVRGKKAGGTKTLALREKVATLITPFNAGNAKAL